jgi:hypothetical protein
MANVRNDNMKKENEESNTICVMTKVMRRKYLMSIQCNHAESNESNNVENENIRETEAD